MTNGGNPGAGAVPVVTQQMLRRERELNTMAEEQTRVRQAIRELLQAGAPVEPGELTAELRVVESRTFSKNILEKLMGVERVAELREQIEPSTCTQLYIRRSPDPSRFLR
jgi:heme oxygenase